MIVIFLIFALVLWNPQFIQLKVTLECWYFLPIIKWRFTLTFITPYLNLLTSAFFYPTAFLISYIFIWTSYLKHLLKDFYRSLFYNTRVFRRNIFFFLWAYFANIIWQNFTFAFDEASFKVCWHISWWSSNSIKDL